MVVLGGSGSITGVILAAIVLTWLPEQLRDIKSAKYAIMALLGGITAVARSHYRGMRAIGIFILGSAVGIGIVMVITAITLVPQLSDDSSRWRMVIYAFLLIFMMLVRPAGLLGRRELWWTRKRLSGEGGT
jgi:branched-chain amino acid transport system permease protein